MNTGRRKIFLKNKESSKEINMSVLEVVVLIPSIKDIYGAGGDSYGAGGGGDYQYELVVITNNIKVVELVANFYWL